MTKIRLYIDNAYPARLSISSVCARGKKSRTSDGYITFTADNFIIYHHNEDTCQSDIIIIESDELLRYVFLPDENEDDDIICDDLNFELSDNSSTIDKLTKLQLEDGEDDEDIRIVFPVNIDQIKKIFDTVKKKTDGIAIELNDQRMQIAQTHDIYFESIQGNVIDRVENDCLKFDFTAYQPKEEEKPFLVVTLFRISDTCDKFDKHKIKNASLDIYPGGIILTSPDGKHSEPWGLPDIDQRRVGKVCLIEEQIKAFKSLGQMAPNSTVKIYVDIQNKHCAFIRFVFHIYTYGQHFKIFPIVL